MTGARRKRVWNWYERHIVKSREVVSSPHGVKYVMEGVLETPSGIAPRILTVWILETGETNPRFVTAYPA